MDAPISGEVSPMSEYEFTLHLALRGVDELPDDLLEQLYEQGCDDALVGIGRPGHVALAFTRRVQTATEAVLTAIRDAYRAMPGSAVLEASPDLVGLTEVADIMGFSRQNMRKILLARECVLPEPVHQGRPTLWHLRHMLEWLVARGYLVDPALLDLAAATMQVNLAAQTAHANESFQRQLQRLRS